MTFLLPEDTHCDGYDFWDAHWSEPMREAAASLLAAQIKERISAFEKTPSVPLYKSIVAESPDLKPILLDTTRKRIFPSSPSAHPDISFGIAAGIFIAASETDDLVRLVDLLPTYVSDLTFHRTEQSIIQYLSKQTSPSHRTKALQLVEHGLRHAKQNILEEISQFPGIDEAYDYLDDKIDAGKLTDRGCGGNYLNQTPAQRKADEVRDAILTKLVEIAVRGRNEYGGYRDDFDDELDPMDRVDSDDSDYEEMQEACRPDLEKEVRTYCSLLQEWPDKKEATEVWDRVKEVSDCGPVFRIDGLAEELASRYECSLL